MAERFHRPVGFSTGQLDEYEGGDDPAASSALAHETAEALLARVRSAPEPEIVERVVAFTDDNGIDTLAELWAHSAAHSLPGALWRLYLVRLLIRQDPAGTSLHFQRGTEVSSTIDQVVAGAPVPAGPDEVVDVADRILRGAFAGDFASALDRAAAFCRLMSAGCTSLADDHEVVEPERATLLTTRALRFSEFAGDFAACARLWRRDALD